ncbi:unnamed protein product [Rotaria magnacalcarata]|uniref:histidine kinase n=1 Tax=Rotaria magnacalcarata TaxID=392030 RepID=A0A819QYF2_9BILA|nr:unnamed protein product [Rotaria magnacalcarata]CAF4039279.1 unnamed protein product [Rotaria magnacalcarata]
MTAFFILQTLDSNQAILDVFTKSTLFDYKEFFSYHNPNFLSTLLLFLFFVIPGLDPVIFQRISIAKNTNQVFKSFTIAGFIMMFLEYGVIAFCGVLLLASNTPGLNEDNIVNHILDNYISTGFKGFFIVGIVAMIMSTADSYINSSAVLFSYDFVKSIGVELTEKKQLVLVRIAALVIGVLALLLGLLSNNLLELILSAYSFYMPIVSVPLILAIFGFRSSSKAVLIGMLAGFITVISFKLFSDINGLIPESVQEHSGSLQFKVIYSLLLFSSILIAFLKPKQQRQELTQQRADYLGEKVHDIDEELKKSVEVKNEFLRNLEHEAHTPIVGITTMGQVLFENYDKLTEEQRRKGLKEISKSSERLSTLVNNMIDVSKLSSLNYVLNKTLINLSDLIYQRLDHCKKLYLENKDLEFICDIEGDLLVNCDEHYITSTLDNLIVNAITYSKDGRITIEFKKNNDLVKFKITDEGIGIPQKELYAIFGTFTVSSKTKTPAGGRGLGLALCKGTIEAHKGQIWCKSNGKKGSTFTFTLPIEESIKLIEARLTKSELQKQK